VNDRPQPAALSYYQRAFQPVNRLYDRLSPYY
jgi:hypothetical protein